MRRIVKLTGTKATIAAVLGLCFVGLLAVSMLWRFRHIPPRQADIEKELNEIMPPPGVTVSQHSVSNKWTQGVIGNYYRGDLTYDQIRAHYDAELARHGWKFKKQIPLTSWGKELGESQTIYCRGNHSADVYFTGNAQNRLGYRYALDISWGLDYCP
jgi:hypothetical protein